MATRADRIDAIRAAVERSKVSRVRRLLGRYQGPKAPFDLVRAPGREVVLLRRSQPIAGGPVWWDRRRWTPEEAERLIQLKVWQPVEAGEGVDRRGLLRMFGETIEM